MKIIKWLLTLREGKQLLAACFITILFLVGLFLNEKKSFSDYRTTTENWKIEEEIKFSEKEEKKNQFIIRILMENNKEILRLTERMDSLSNVIIFMNQKNHVHEK